MQISEPCALSVGVIARRPFPPLPQAKIWLSGEREIQETQFACSLSACNRYRDRCPSAVTAAPKHLIYQLRFANGRTNW